VRVGQRVIQTMLAANRGEIALRIFRTCRDAGIGTVAVYSDADAAAPHVTAADAAVRLPGHAPADTYLNAGLIIKAAADAGADAIHPGYGFGSENADFARAVTSAGLTWVGPPPGAIEAMGSKVASKRLMARAGVPVLPGLDPAAVTAADLPVLVKASAGGGGRGMRIVRTLDELPGAVASASAEAAAAFGDPAVFCEPYLEAGRHIEVQVLADAHGTTWTLPERECSIQRRHQKIIEETPSPSVDEPARERLLEAARKAAGAVGYASAGTVEFLAAPDGSFYFLEMNTRLQVEHPVTECVTGLDLVAWQLRVAEGERLPAAPPASSGHAIEARLCAEDPARDWQPQAGTLHGFHIPGVAAEFTVPRRHGVRLDSGVRSGSAVSVHYDPLLAKVIAWEPDRGSAARVLAATLAGARLHGLVTNRDLLVNVLRHPAFLAGETDTAFLGRHGLGTLARPLAGPEAVRLSVLAAALAGAAANRAGARVLGGLPGGWRNVRSAPQRKRYLLAGGGPGGPGGQAGGGQDGRERNGGRHDGHVHEVAYSLTRDGFRSPGYDGVELLSAAPDEVVLAAGGVRRTFSVARYPGLVCVDSPLGPVSLVPVPRFTEPGAVPAPGSLTAPMPGTVLRIAAQEGDTVAAGAPLLWLEAMKMEHQVCAPASGVVSAILVRVGQQVGTGTVLAVIGEPDAPASGRHTPPAGGRGA
jgi:propionyl-CoA carboxylase alpha chain